MSLADEIKLLQENTCAALDASHDYFTNTKTAWRLVQQFVATGHSITMRNQATGNIVTEAELPELAQEYVVGYLASATFQDFVSHFEIFLFDLIRAWLREYPHSLLGKQLSFQTVFDSRDKDEIVGAVVDSEVMAIAYKRVDGWFKYLDNLVRLGCPSANEIERIAEIKASRDVLVHNKGIANTVYADKSGGRARCHAGDRLEIPEAYHYQSWTLLRKVVTDLAEAATKKATP